MQFPLSLISQLQSVNGFDEASFLRAHAEPAVTSVRLHPLKGAGTTIAGDKIPWCDDGILLKERPVFTLDPAYHAGAYYVQEASSMFLEHAWKHTVDDNSRLRVLDLCAAPGGKSTLIAALLKPGSLLLSNEVIRTRASILEENMVRWGYPNTWVVCNDPRDFGSLEGYFDAMIVDAPCSGSGLFRKDARALNEWSEDNVALCSARQKRILADVWPSLKQNGIIIYATCSFSLEEDEQILDWLATEYDCETVSVPVPETWGISEVVSPFRRFSGYRFFPGKVKGEGFFMAVIRKTGNAGSPKPVKFKTTNMSRIAEQTAHLLLPGERQFIEWNKDMFSALHPDHLPDWHLLSKALYFRKVGLNIGSPSAKEWLPAHDIALSVDASGSIPAINASREQALQFLKREDFGAGEGEKGWRLVKFNNLGLGWIKCIGNRSNNYLPKHWRIRMEIPDEDSE